VSSGSNADARGRVAELDWWQTIEVAPGLVTPGWWDLRPTAERLPWPSAVAGLRCLDIGIGHKKLHSLR
jgi:tRNA (mo5U34)-methyltransferase